MSSAFFCRPATPHSLADLIAADFCALFPWRGDWRRVAYLLTDLVTPHPLREGRQQRLVECVHRHSGAVAGIGAYGPTEFSSTTWQLYLAATLPEFRRQGVNEMLVRHRLAAIERERLPGQPLSVMASTRRRALFCCLGFDYLAPGANGAAVMIKHLPAPSAHHQEPPCAHSPLPSPLLLP